jgi:hypothetical protein
MHNRHQRLLDRLTSQSLDGLELENNLHLFNWTGALIYGDDAPPVRDTFEDEPEKDLKDWVLHLHGNPIAQNLNRPDYSAQSVPTTSADEQRKKIFTGDDKPDRRFVTRPTAAAAFDLVQQGDRPINPWAPDWTPIEPRINTSVDIQVWHWMVSELAERCDRPHIPITQVQQYKLRELRQYLEAGEVGGDRVAQIIQGFYDGTASRVQHQAADKLLRIEREQARWADHAKLAVLDADSSIHEALTLTNTAACWVAIENLQQLYNFVWSGVRSLVNHMTLGRSYLVSKQDGGL